MSAHPVRLAVALVLGARLSLAPSAVAQAPADAQDAPTPRCVELGAVVGATWNMPTAGLLASVPAHRWLAVEGTVNAGSRTVLSQGQLRIRLGHHQPTQRSLVVGLTHIGGRNERLTPGTAAHAGVSFQQAVAPHLALRLDLQMLAPFADGPGADLRAALGVVWHRRRSAAAPASAGAANIRRSPE